MVESIKQISQILSVFSAIAVSLTAILALLSTFFRPIRNFVGWIFKRIVGDKNKNEELIKKIDDVKTSLSKEVEDVRVDLTKRIQDVSDSNDKNEMKRLRWEILSFANSCKNKRRHTQDEFRHIIEIHDDYKKILASTGLENGFLDAEYEYIQRIYTRRQEKNDFLVVGDLDDLE